MAHVIHLGLWRLLGAALLGVMRCIELRAARARLRWLSAARQKTCRIHLKMSDWAVLSNIARVTPQLEFI